MRRELGSQKAGRAIKRVAMNEIYRNSVGKESTEERSCPLDAYRPKGQGTNVGTASWT